MREDLNKFNKYKDAIHEHQEAKGIDWTVELQLDRQTKLDEWREYYIYEHRKRRALEKNLDRAKKALEPVKEAFEEAKRNGSVSISESVLLGRQAEISKYEDKISAARTQVELWQKRLDAIRFEDSLSAPARRMLLDEAEDDLKLAQERLEAEKSDEWEQLGKEATRLHAKQRLTFFQRKVDYANKCLQEWDAFLESIAAQFAEVASEYGSSSLGSQYSRNLMDKWGRCYAYMYKRLRWAQIADEEWAEQQEKNVKRGYPRTERTERDKAIDDLANPLDSVRPIKALLAWFERAFPGIAARHTPLVQDGHSSHNGDQNEADLPPSSKPLPNESEGKASQTKGGKSRRGKGKSSRERPRSPLCQVQPLKVSKPRQRGRQQKQTQVTVRRSERIYQQTHGSLPSAVRRCTRMLKGAEKSRASPFSQDGKFTQLGTMTKRRSARRTTSNTYTALPKSPQGISKTRRSKTASKKKYV